MERQESREECQGERGVCKGLSVKRIVLRGEGRGEERSIYL